MDTKRRISFEVSEEHYNKLKDHLPYGLMNRVLSAVAEDVIVMLDEFGPLFVLAVLEKKVSYRGRLEKKC